MFERSLRVVRVLGCITAAAICPVAPARAQHLPFTSYTEAQGLAANDASAAVEDRRGFLWIGTYHGLSRFDGSQFRTFGKERGLSDERVTSLVNGSEGVLWVGTRTGVYRFDLRDGGVFVPIPVEGRRVRWDYSVLALDRDGQLWCGADGLYRLEHVSDGGQVLRRVSLPQGVSLPFVNALAADQDGNIWAAGYDQIYRRSADGRFETIRGPPAPPSAITFLSADSHGRVWVTAAGGLWVIDRSEASSEACCVRRVLKADTVPWAGPVWKPNGGFWLGISSGLLEFDGSERALRRISREQGLAGDGPEPLLLDRGGDLWIAIDLTALQRLAADGLTAYGESEGLEARMINSVFNTDTGALVAIGRPHIVQRLAGHRFTVTRPMMPGAVRGPGWGWYQVDLQDRFGQWWMSTDDGVVHWPAVRGPEDLARTRAKELLADRECFRGKAVFRLYEDSHSDMWIGTVADARPTLYRWNRATGRIDCFSTASFLERESAPTAFLDDGRGTLWIGFYEGQVARYRNGRFTCVLDCVNPSQGLITGMMLDRRGRLWIATDRTGVIRLDRIDADRPQIVHLTTAEGLTSNRTRAVLEDRFGRIYIGTEMGIDAIETGGGQMRHYGVEDGLPHPFINMAQADRDGDLWFGTLNGLARLHPLPDAPEVAAREVLIDGVRVAGEPRPVSASGADEIDGIVLGSDQRNLEVDFVGLPRRTSRTLRFQYRLTDTESWSPPSSNRSIVLASLSAGDHRLQIRSIDPGGQPSPRIAMVSFRVLVPLYRRAWFLGLVTLGGLALTVTAYRWRLAYVRALERQRTDIAMDLHDEMGSRLGSIGLLADLAAAEPGSGEGQRARLEQIAETAADIGSSLADIVWSLRRGVMTLEEVARHLTVHGHRLFPGPAPVFHVRVPEVWPAVEMSPAVGRCVLLVGLEALHNCARHAKAKLVTLDFHQSGRDWVLGVSDDGCGIVPGAATSSGSGFGLLTMRRRAEEIAGTLVVDSLPGTGTTVQLTFAPRGRDRSMDRMNIRGIRPRARGMT